MASIRSLIGVMVIVCLLTVASLTAILPHTSTEYLQRSVLLLLSTLLVGILFGPSVLRQCVKYRRKDDGGNIDDPSNNRKGRWANLLAKSRSRRQRRKVQMYHCFSKNQQVITLNTSVRSPLGFPVNEYGSNSVVFLGKTGNPDSPAFRRVLKLDKVLEPEQLSRIRTEASKGMYKWRKDRYLQILIYEHFPP